MQTVGRYRILGELGRGAMGVVYRAQDPAIGREVAIKTIRLSELADASERTKLRERLMREAQSAGMLSHPNIVTIYDIAEEGDLAYIAMEYVPGPTLDRLTATNPPDGAQALSILSQMAAALDYAHKRGIVHRDIKPANIMIQDGNVAKITDFGVARIESHQRTQAGVLMGTPGYMSPEQIQSREIDGRSDQFSLAVIAYELLTGEKPFAGDSIATLAYRIAREDPAPVHRLNPTLDWPVDTVIRRALAKNPADRYPTCSDFAFALENACRACRKWKPLIAGSAEGMATIAGPVNERVQEPVKEPVKEPVRPPSSVRTIDIPTAPLFGYPARRAGSSDASPAETAEPATGVEEPPRDPAFLRFLRTLALILVGGGIAVAIVVGGLHYLQQRREQTKVEAPAESAPAPVRSPRPSAMGPSTPPETAAVPAETGAAAKQDETPQPSEKPVTAPARGDTTAIAETRLVTNPPGAFVVVDGSSQLSCQSPCALALPGGRHTLAATLAGYRRSLRIFGVPQDSEVFLSLDRASGTVMVRSEPKGASILVDGQMRSEKTPALLTLPVGSYTIDLELSGHRERQTVDVKDSAITNVAVSF